VYRTNPLLADTDGDGHTDGEEAFILFTDPMDSFSWIVYFGEGTSNDTDVDGIADSFEGTSDADGDGIPNHRDLDSDNDGILDFTEGWRFPLAPPPDTDGDGTPNFLDTDSDNDGVSDNDEAFEAMTREVNGTTPVDFYGDPSATDTDGDGIANYLDDDDDGDGILTVNEDANGNGDPTDDDTDGDGIPNYLDANS